MVNSREPCCDRCIFGREGVSGLECHKSPPVRLPRQFAPQSDAGNRVRDETLIWGWPHVERSDWCGEFKPVPAYPIR